MDRLISPILVGHVAHLLQWADGPGHGVDSLKGHNLGDGRVHLQFHDLFLVTWRLLRHDRVKKGTNGTERSSFMTKRDKRIQSSPAGTTGLDRALSLASV